MSDMLNTDDSDQLFDTEASEDTADTATDTTEGTEEPKEGEQGQEVLDLQEPSSGKSTKTSNAATVRAKQAEVWANRIMSGEKTLDDMPKNLGWLKKDVEKLLDGDTVKSSVSVEEVVRDEVAFKSQMERINSLSLTKSQRSELQSEYSDLRLRGYSRSEALKKASKIAGIQLNSTEGDVEARKRDMALPKNQGSQNTEDVDVNDTKITDPKFRKLPEKKRLEILKRMATT